MISAKVNTEIDAPNGQLKIELLEGSSDGIVGAHAISGYSVEDSDAIREGGVHVVATWQVVSPYHPLQSPYTVTACHQMVHALPRYPWSVAPVVRNSRLPLRRGEPCVRRMRLLRTSGAAS